MWQMHCSNAQQNNLSKMLVEHVGDGLLTVCWVALCWTPISCVTLVVCCAVSIPSLSRWEGRHHSRLPTSKIVSS
jgi:hypothetical protein